ncbi:Bug family tripartite tricarboxylate transporter substrate binding protein [Paracandidimonas soli]|uniref:Bug family tripartite tricarboxylate transporter substrate binding protein n=1 Tax=Paracandidimonas soli TaxID=1917182 RepID=UPI00334246B4
MQTHSPHKRSSLRALTLGLAATATALLPAAASAAEPWPDKPIRLVVPFAAGGNTDIFARLIASQIENDLGTTIVIENRGGASGNIGAENVARAQPDGYTLLMGTIGTQAINYSIYKDIRFQPESFAPISMIGSVPNVLIISPNLKVDSVQELIEYGKTNPGKLSFASSGAGSSIHLSGEMFKVRTGVDMVHVPYKGSAPAVTDIIGGQVDLMFDNLPVSLPFIKNGSLKALAVTSAKRSPSLPELPTMEEAGVENFDVGSWFGLLAPTGTPESIVNRINAAVQKAMGAPALQKRIVELGAEPIYKGPKEFSDFIDAEIVKWRQVVEASQATAGN